MDPAAKKKGRAPTEKKGELKLAQKESQGVEIGIKVAPTRRRTTKTSAIPSVVVPNDKDVMEDSAMLSPGTRKSTRAATVRRTVEMQIKQQIAQVSVLFCGVESLIRLA